jgi:hypothetical protein
LLIMNTKAIIRFPILFTDHTPFYLLVKITAKIPK